MKILQNLLQAQLGQREAKEYALVFSSELRDHLEAIQAEHRNSRHKVKPVALANGKWMICADVLTEVGGRGIYTDGFAHLDQSLFSQVEILPWQDAIALLPKNEEQE